MVSRTLRSVTYAVPVAALAATVWWQAAGWPVPMTVAAVVAAVAWQAFLLRQSLRLEQQVDHDQLTGLPGRVLLRERLGAVLRNGHRVALVFVDLDGFKRVNDADGHAAGDRILIEVARRLERSAGAGAFVARYGGDEFAIVIRAAEPEARAVAARVANALPWPASVGVAVSHGGDADPDALLAEADAAMYAAKPGATELS
ncbi:MAG TPA: GGDEF domain-containing protein [Jiangellaceae bacterium]|jgi:diguanylate cyclase (GGDEF)-like protein|nr:GGDEF domain-containing protein [Jiangellaceae bacterium]